MAGHAAAAGGAPGPARIEHALRRLAEGRLDRPTPAPLAPPTRPKKKPPG